ncbi:MAG: PQQ-dependent sugar dehydrogenase, partial [Planctomycetota bacterium]|nr:PQQ-dependent sugar dehydrogenase [Planctomycetota bacterium]
MTRAAWTIALVVVSSSTGVGGAEDAPGDAPKDRAVYESAALTQRGDPKRGRELFLDEERTRCVTCHKVGRAGGEVGPDLSRIGGKFDRPHLIESLLEPSLQIVEGYRATAVVTVDGRIETGVVKEQSEKSVTLLDSNGEKRVIPVAEIAKREESAVSLMPDGLTNVLTAAEFTDLVAYLETLRPAGKPQFGAGVIGPIRLRPGFEVETVATGLTGCAALETTTDGRVFICEQKGALRVVRDGRLLERPFVVVPVDDTWERGLIGVTVPPGFPGTPFVYVCYVARRPFPHHCVSRFTADGDIAVPGSEQILLRGDDQRKLGGNVPAGHQGGALHFGTDGKLYVAIGEQTAETPSQRLDSFQGKMLRINPDGTIPDDN